MFKGNIGNLMRQAQQMQDAMQKDAYYGTQAKHAEEDIELMRNRAKVLSLLAFLVHKYKY